MMRIKKKSQEVSEKASRSFRGKTQEISKGKFKKKSHGGSSRRRVRIAGEINY